MPDDQRPGVENGGAGQMPPPPPRQRTWWERRRVPKWVVVLVAIFLALQVIGYSAVALTEGPGKAIALLLANISPFGTSSPAAQLPDFQAKKCPGKMKSEAVSSARKFFWIFTYTYTEARSYCLDAELLPSSST